MIPEIVEFKVVCYSFNWHLDNGRRLHQIVIAMNVVLPECSINDGTHTQHIGNLLSIIQ